MKGRVHPGEMVAVAVDILKEIANSFPLTLYALNSRHILSLLYSVTLNLINDPFQ